MLIIDTLPSWKQKPLANKKKYGQNGFCV